MKLSTPIISNWLSDTVVFSEIIVGDCVISSCVLSDLDKGLSPDCLYIGQSGLHSEYDTEEKTVICRADKDIIVVRADNEIDIYKSVMDAFIFYSQWESDLKDAVISQAPFQEIAEIAYGAFCTDIIIFSWSGIILAWVQSNGKNDVPTALDPAMFRKIQEGLVCRKVAQNIMPAGFVDTPVVKSCISSNIFFANGSFVLMYLSSKVIEMNKAHLQLVLTMRSILSYLRPNNLEDTTFEPIYSEFINILEGQPVDSVKLKNALGFKDWLNSGKYLLYSFKSHSNLLVKRKSVNHMLTDKISASIVFSYGDMVLMVIPEKERESCNKILPAIMPYFDLSGGVSMPFSEWEDLPAAFGQSKSAIKIGGDVPGVLYTCEDYAFSYIMDRISEQCTKLNLVAPDVLLLKKYDEENNTELLRTLNVFIKNQSNMTASAKQLFIHLSSMKYRIKKIQSMISLDLGKYENRMFLLFSSEIELRNL